MIGPPLLCAVALVYFAVAYQYLLIGKWGMTLAFTAYALANIGFALDFNE